MELGLLWSKLQHSSLGWVAEGRIIIDFYWGTEFFEQCWGLNDSSSLTTPPALENILSQGTEDAGEHKNASASWYKWGYWCFCWAQNTSGSSDLARFTSDKYQSTSTVASAVALELLLLWSTVLCSRCQRSLLFVDWPASEEAGSCAGGVLVEPELLITIAHSDFNLVTASCSFPWFKNPSFWIWDPIMWVWSSHLMILTVLHFPWPSGPSCHPAALLNWTLGLLVTVW